MFFIDHGVYEYFFTLHITTEFTVRWCSCSIILCVGIMSLDELQQRLVAARGRNKQEISRLFSS